MGLNYGEAPRLVSMNDAAVAYRRICARVDALVRGRDDIAELPVPACPGWTIRQVVAHLVGVAQDIVALNLDEKGTAPWANAQVARLGEHSIDELLARWAQSLDAVSTNLALASDAGVCQLVFDTLTHEHDIRGALGEPGSRTGDLTFTTALSFMTTTGDQFIRHARLPSFRLSTPSLGAVQMGDPHTAPGQLALSISDFDALRSFGGRRSVKQLLALPWDKDPTLLMPAFTQLLPALTNGGLRPPSHDLIE
ncbi:maleylpyruvate isomerase family mycothiol-dependent enzyme [Mycobacterium paraterrae]|uniref:Maleylpyruvate isomerase family mycothiol-dependent enzyme n=1 Tax=Mycobacterium paraterrae TaxID=577492 RepID=A0ABY3VJK9_9MYCO|nr:maleylpyruvate isomerase family mycothiol-dependent enzyme [Mycobacterium paraterrae]UMB69584.1 maleylpyruvate isomerase family mycothiol-dependent enzyme [Mycobacterium paraterrae]